MKWISTFILTAILLLGFSPVVFAAGDTFSTQITSTPTEFSSEPGKMTQDEAKYIARGGSAIPETESSKIASFIERKGFEVVELMQGFVQPFAIIVFIACAIMSLIGAFGNGHLISRGIIGMLIAATLYVVALYAPEILDSFLSWTTS